jgi:CubicO group peptidase (beta-lactamase class C family)
VAAVTAPADQPAPPPAEVHGSCDERFSSVRDLLVASLAAGSDLGASVAVSLDGDLVVDLWGGWADPARTVPWERDTITNVWSTTKTMTALCALMLVDAGALDLDAAVSRYWPEFGAGGKEGRVLLRHVLGHTSGLPGWSQPITVDDLYDWEKATSLLAAQEPWWEPGTASGYHALTQGYLVGEVIRRVTGQSTGTFFREKVAGPLAADFHIGIDPAEFSRISNIIPPPPPTAIGEISETALRVLANPPMSAEIAWTEPWRRAEIPAANGHGNARAVAGIQSVIANGGEAGGVRLLSEAGCARILAEQAYGQDLVLGVPIRFGVGYALPSPEMPVRTDHRACFWGGWGGSVVAIDLDAHLVIAYVMNKMGEGLVGDDRGIGLVLAAQAALSD